MKEKLLIKIGGSLFFEEPEVIKGVLEKISLLKYHYKLFIVVGSGPLGEDYKHLCKLIGLNRSDHNSAPCVDDRDIWNLIQAINLKILEFLITSADIDMCVALSDGIKEDKSSDNVVMIKPLDSFLSDWWRRCQKSFCIEDRPYVKDINIQKTDAKAMLYGNKMGIKRFILLTDVSGVYTSDPKKNINAKLITHLTPEELKEKEFVRGETTGLDKGISILMKNLLPQETELYVLSHKAFANLSDTDNIINNLRTEGTWISNNTIMQ